MPLEPRRLRDLTPIDATTVAVVRASCARLAENPVELTQEFYRQLFQMAPGVRSMFPEDMTPQSEKLLQALLGAVQALDHPEKVESALRRLGEGHRRRHGVTNEMYVYVGHSLVRAIGRLSGHMESSVGSAWIAVYEWMAAVMIDGAEAGAAAEHPRHADDLRTPQGPPSPPPGPPQPAEQPVDDYPDQDLTAIRDPLPAYPARSAIRVSPSRRN